jgi:hypothetical protein
MNTTTKPKRGPKPQARLPWEPMQALWEPGTWDNVIADALGTTRGVVQAYKRRGVNVWVADQYAITLGLHPSAIWGNLWWDLVDLEDSDAA